MTCPECGAPVVRHAATGRPPAYCSIACRRRAGDRIRRERRRLAAEAHWQRVLGADRQVTA